MARGQKIRSGDFQVEGLRELSRALKGLGPEAQAELKNASRSVADFVANDARAAATSLGGVAAHAAPSIKAVGGATGAGVAFGGATHPEAGGAAWGSVRFTQFKPWRGKTGYFPYPQIKDNADRIVSEYTTAVNQTIERRFPQ